MTLYNLTVLQNATSIVNLATGVNTISNGLYGGMLFIIIYLLLFITVKEEYLPNVMLGAGTVMSIIAWLLFGLGLIPWWSLGINITLLISAIFYKIWGGST